MSWFDEQIRERKVKDEAVFEESFSNMAKSVIGRRAFDILDDNKILDDAIEAVLNYYHIKGNDIPERISDIDDRIEYAMRPNGIMRRSVRLTGEWYKDALGAMIGIRRDDGSRVALIPGDFSGYYYVDHKTGVKEKITKKNASLFEEAAYVFYKPFPLRKISLKDVAGFVVGTITAGDYVLCALATLIVTLIGMLTPMLTSVLTGRVVDNHDINLLIAGAVFLMCSSIGGVLVTMIKNIILARVSIRMDSAVSSATMMRILSLPPSFFKNYSAGELSNYEMQVNSLCQIMINTVLSTGLTSIFSVCYIIQIFRYAPALTFPALIILVITILISVVSTVMRMRNTRRRLAADALESGVSYEMISGVQKVRLSGAEKRAFAKWANIYAQSAEPTYNPNWLIKLSPVMTSAVTIIGTIVLYSFAIANDVSVSDYYAFNSAYGLVSAAFISLAGIAESIAQIKPVLELVKPIFDAEPEISEGKNVVSSISGNIELNNICFKYDEDAPNVIDGLSLRIKSGQYVAIVGKTGCGKSTLVRLMLGFEKPQKGAIYYDGKDIESMDLKSLRQNIGVVMQDGKLFSGDIFHNITIASPKLTVDDAWEAAELSGIADDIRSMPMGMYTLLSEGGGGISGGQRQRLMIARAIAPKPKLLIFDEATSALDNVTQKKVSDSLDNLKCTRIVIAHRLSTIRNCDRIIVLDDGKIIEDGNYEQLIQDKGFFAELVERQQTRVDGGEA